MEEIRRMADPWGLVPPAKVKHCLLPPPPAHFPPLPRGPWVTHTSPSLHSKPWRSGYKLSLLMLPCSTDTAWNGMKILSQPYLAHLYIQNMCSGSFLLPSIYSSLKAQHLPGKREGKNRSSHFFIYFFFFFFFQQINQMPLITQMIEIQLFAEWYTVLINLNLHCMSLELMFLFLIRRNLAGGSDWINRSRFLYSWSVNRRGVTSALGPPYLVGALSSASCQGQAPGRAVISSHWRQSGQRRQITLQDDLLQPCQNETHKMATVTPKIAPGVFTW